MDSQGLFKGMFQSMAMNSGIVAVVDFLNKWGLTFIGLGLMFGLFTQLALFFGMLLLVMYYLSHPPLASVTYILPQEGSYLWVNKTLIEIFAMAVLLVFPTGHIVGVDRLIFKKQQKVRIP
jgi:thiosulfate dehydrogenase [quinone] large subunit